MNTNPPATTYEGQLAVRVDELLPGLDTGARLGLLGVMDPDDLRTSLAFIASMFPQVFDFALVRDRAMTERLVDRLGEDQADDDETAKCTRHAADDGASEPGGALGALLGAVLAEGHSARFVRAAEDGVYFADLVSTTGSQASAYGRTPLGALQGAAAEYGIGDVDDVDDDEPYCSACGAAVGIFQGQQAKGWQHFHGEGTAASPVELFDAGHEPVIALQRAVERAVPRTDALPAAGRRDQRGAALAIRMSRKDGAR